MTTIIYFIIAIIIAYMLGSICSGFILGKILRNIDLRDCGSRNIGATNTLRVLGIIPGIISLAFDITKGYVAVEIGRIILNYNTNTKLEIYLVFIGIAVILGHIFPIFLKFKGGKGVATAAGVFLNISIMPLFIALIIFIIVVAITRYVSLGSLSSAIALLITQFIYTLKNVRELPYFILSAIVVTFIFVKHIPNIKRLRKGTESKIKFSKNIKSISKYSGKGDNVH